MFLLAKGSENCNNGHPSALDNFPINIFLRENASKQELNNCNQTDSMISECVSVTGHLRFHATQQFQSNFLLPLCRIQRKEIFHAHTDLLATRSQANNAHLINRDGQNEETKQGANNRQEYRMNSAKFEF